MSKFRRLTLEESREEFPLLNEEARKALKGGCSMCDEAERQGEAYYSQTAYENLDFFGLWKGGVVCGIGYVGPTTNAYSGMDRCNFHGTFYGSDGGCYACYHESHDHCLLHDECYSDYCNPCRQLYLDSLSTCWEHGNSYDSINGGYCQGCFLDGFNRYYCSDHNYYRDAYCQQCFIDEQNENPFRSDTLYYCPVHYYTDYLTYCVECDPGYNFNPGSGGGHPDPGGTGGIENGFYTVEHVVSQMTNSSFTGEDKTKLQETLNDLLGEKAGRYLYDKIMAEDSSFKITFDIGNTPMQNIDGEKWQSPAAYHKGSNMISFRENDTIMLAYLGEEFVHAVQDYTYGDQMTRKNPNYEFEAKIIRDVLCGNFGNQTCFDDQEKYLDFIGNIASGVYDSSTIVDEYNKFYSEWKDPEGIKQEIESGSLYYYNYSESISFDPVLLKEIVGLYQK